MVICVISLETLGIYADYAGPLLKIHLSKPLFALQQLSLCPQASHSSSPHTHRQSITLSSALLCSLSLKTLGSSSSSSAVYLSILPIPVSLSLKTLGSSLSLLCSPSFCPLGLGSPSPNRQNVQSRALGSLGYSSSVLLLLLLLLGSLGYSSSPHAHRHGPVLYLAVLFGSSSCSSALSSVNCGKATFLFRTHGCRYCFAMEAPGGLTVMASGPSGPSPSCTNKDAADAGIRDPTPTNTNVDTNVDIGEVTSYRHTPSADYDDGEIEDEPKI
ncbi:hypothetical protein Cgig2_009285 [Carnegiea gigantea]|uniref:Uncharacterized protein n=1 Tax=Carnegiea gigantea TaxID=171969 RepID=A0A9Q1JI13_9CARY|nr:hypothetical protein Cgig2_009285 [Carnegiea gigantea]